MTVPALRDLISQYFNDEELRQLCLDLNIEYEDLSGETRTARSQSLVKHCLRRDRLPDLVNRCAELRPNVNWPEKFETSKQSDFDAPRKPNNNASPQSCKSRFAILVIGGIIILISICGSLTYIIQNNLESASTEVTPTEAALAHIPTPFDSATPTLPTATVVPTLVAEPTLPPSTIEATAIIEIIATETKEATEMVSPSPPPSSLTSSRGTGIFLLDQEGLGSSALDVALGDVDNDGDLDIFALSRDTANKVWLNMGNGIFTDSGQTIGNNFAFAVELGDLDNDGDLDAFVVYGIFQGRPNKVYLNNGLGTFTDNGQDLGNSVGSDVALGDVDGDGDLDAFVPKQDGVPNTLWINNGNGFFSDSGQALGDPHAYTVVLGDLDNDGDLDAFLANSSTPNKVLLNDGSGTFTELGQAIGSGNSYGAALGDFDKDGDLDAFVANYNQPDKVWFNKGNGIFVDSEQALGNSASVFVDLGDVDGDGDLDAFVVSGIAGGRPNHVWLNNGHGQFADNGLPMGNANNRSVDLGDLNGDGTLDAFVGGYQKGVNEIWINLPIE